MGPRRGGREESRTRPLTSSDKLREPGDGGVRVSQRHRQDEGLTSAVVNDSERTLQRLAPSTDGSAMSSSLVVQVSLRRTPVPCR